jgi:hypothetical protein
MGFVGGGNKAFDLRHRMVSKSPQQVMHKGKVAELALLISASDKNAADKSPVPPRTWIAQLIRLSTTSNKH